MFSCVRCLPATLCAATGLLLAAISPAQRPVQRLNRVPSSADARVTLRDTAGPHTSGAESVGELPGNTELTSLSLVLKPTAAQDAALDKLLADQANPSSPSYQQWLTPEQFGERFGAADADIQVLENWLQRNGFTVQSVARSRNRIVFSGDAATAESAFHTSLRRYRRDGRDFFENSDAVQLPASLAEVVSGVTGLSSYRPLAPQALRVRPNYTTSTGTHYLVPDDLRTIYGTNTLINSGYNGSGIKIGVIGQSAVDTQQLTYFQQKTGQTLNLPTMVLVPNTGVSNRRDGDEQESELDLEYAGGNAPGASIQFIYTGCTNSSSTTMLPSTTTCNNDVFDALTYAVTNNLAPILSLSYGACETQVGSYANMFEPVLKQANTQGQTILNSSGDFGPANCEMGNNPRVATAGLSVTYPSSSPYVTGVGGTQLTSDSSTYWSNTNNSFLGSALSYVPETSWNDSSLASSLAASGGGVSQLFAKPYWQAGTGVPADGFRDTPDVAFSASFKEFAYLTCDAGGPCTSGTKSFTLTGSQQDGGGVGGTSASTPTFAGMLAVIEQANGGKALGNINVSLYALAQGSSASKVFHDITTGNNLVPCTTGTPNCTSGTLGYSAGVGYDLVTGLGSIDAPSLRTALAGYAATTPRIALTVPTSVNAGAAVTLSALIAGSGSVPTGTVSFSVDGQAVGTAQVQSSGSAGYSYSGFSVGTHTVSAAYSGDTTYSAASVSLTITASAVTPTLVLTASPASPAINTAVTLTATLTSAAGVPTGSITFNGEVGSGSIPVVNGVATFTVSNGFSNAGLHVVGATYNPATGGAGTVFTGTSASLNLNVTAGSQTQTPTLQVTVNPTAAVAGQLLSVTVMANGTAGNPTGRVLLTVDKAGPGVTATLTGGTLIASVFAPGTPGTHTVQATYYGDNTYLGATASANFTVVTPSTSIAITPSSLTAAFGSSATATISVTAVAASGLTAFAPLQFVSSTGATFQGCYSISPKSLNVTSAAASTATLTLYTSAGSCTTAGRMPLRLNQIAASGGGRNIARWAVLPLPLLLLLVRRRRWNGAAVAVLALVACFALLGCGSGSTTSTGSGGGGTGTGTGSGGSTSSNAGTYVFRVTANTNGTNTSLSANTTVTLNVQ